MLDFARSIIYPSSVQRKLKAQNLSPHSVHKIATAFLLNFLIFVIFVGILGGTVKTLLDLKLLFTQNVEVVIKQALINILIIFALIEVLKTALSYVSEGRVRVTFIIDTVLIVMLNELMSHWFKGGSQTTFVTMGGIILLLIGVRVLAIFFSPDQND